MKAKICPICGEEFIPKHSNQRYCMQPKSHICPICGKSFERICTKNNAGGDTCGDRACRIKYASLKKQEFYAQTTKICVLCGKEFHPKNNTQRVCSDTHYATCTVCGKKFRIKDIDAYLSRPVKTCSSECRNKSISMNTRSKDPAIIAKMLSTKKDKYGDNFGSVIARKSMQTYYEKTGFKHIAYNPEVRSKRFSNAKESKLEQRICSLLDSYHIEYQHLYFLSNGDLSHEFDFYIPKYKILIDADGLYYHCYIGDADGKHSREDYDEIRLNLIPKDHIFHIIVEGCEDADIKYLVNVLKDMDADIFNYDSEVFNWCRHIGFPYPAYNIERMSKDYDHLCRYNEPDYNRNCRFGLSIIKTYHKSIYDAHVKGYISPYEAWFDDDMLKKVIVNRFIYINTVDPSKILAGLNISKLCPRVSIFNPVLARHITKKYLSEYSTVFDPFSGFSGRLLGVCSTGKQYIGQDLNEHAVSESNHIINAFSLNAKIIQKDIFDSSGTYECLLTCPPYADKEIYNNETVFQSCDNWIDECIARFRCNRYVFVVDRTEKYKSHIAEELVAKSHFTDVHEYIVVINRLS